MRPFAVAAKSRERTEQRKFRNDEIDNLRRLDAKRAFAKEISERIRRLVVGDLQNSLIDRENDNLAGTVGFVPDVQRFAGLRFGCGLQIDLQPAFFDVGRERDDAVTERADKNFLGIERPHKGDIDIAAALKLLRQTNVLDTAGGSGLKPTKTVNFFPFDRDETVAAVWRRHAHRNFISGAVLFGVKFDLQFGVFLQGPGHCSLTHDRKAQLA